MKTSCLALCAVVGSAVPAWSQQSQAEPIETKPTERETDAERRSSLVQRPPLAPRRGNGPPGGNGPAVFPHEFRTIDGWNNNPGHPEWGGVGFAMIRKAPDAYFDGIGDLPARMDGPSPRLVSNAVAAQNQPTPNSAGASDFLWQWGQFLDHDLDETPIGDPGESMDIPVPAGDFYFDPDGTGAAVISFDRSAYTMIGNVRQQMNNITAFIDASNVYGSEHDRADALRTMDGTGRLRVSEGGLLPYNVDGFPNAPTDHDPSFFLAGDIRCNEQIGLIAMHTLFVREHNHWAGVIAGDHPGLSGDEVYEHARAIVAAEMQAITYNEFLPLLLGPGAMPPYTGYKPMLDPRISNEFATAAYRVGHTMLSPTIRRLGADGFAIEAGHIALANAFFSPQEIIDHGIAPVLRGLASQRSQEIDTKIIDDVRNFLFGLPGHGGFDLASLNIQRGRDHGLCDYNTMRAAIGRPPVTGFGQITPDPEIAAGLAAVYETVNDVDPWVGLLAEPHAPGAMVGESLRRILGDQFARLRDGDRFWYGSYLPPQLRDMVDQQTLAVIIRRNTPAGTELPDDVFRVERCVADLTGDGVLDLLDVQVFIAAFSAMAPEGDLNLDGRFDLGDIQEFLASFGAGCP